MVVFVGFLTTFGKRVFVLEEVSDGRLGGQLWAFVQSKWWAALPTTLLLSAGLPPQRIGFGPKTRPTTASRRSRCWNSPHWPPTKPTRMIPLTPQCSGPMPRARCEWRGERGERTGMGRRLAAYLRKRRACVAGATQLDIYIYTSIHVYLEPVLMGKEGGWWSNIEVTQVLGTSRHLPCCGRWDTRLVAAGFST